MSDQELKPCPFCGNDPHIWPKVQGYGPKATCQNHKCRLDGSFTFDVWNTRHQSPQQINAILFDGFAVYEALSDKEKRYTTPENVSAVLDAVVRAIKADQLEGES